MRICLFFVMVFSAFKLTFGQELNCQVTIINDARLELTNVEREVLQQLETVVYEFMNNTKWTKDKFTVEERINCNIQIQINEIPSSGSFKGSLQVQSSRPTFNSSYNTTLFNYQDDNLEFSYNRNSIFVYAPNQFRDNLTSVLAFYAYFILGMDYDSFSNKGGTKYFTEAQQIVNNAQSSGFAGWTSNEKGKNNRYWLVDNILHELFTPLRECMYHYHRKALDKMYEDKILARSEVYNALNMLVKLTSTRPNSLNALNFLSAKSTELKNLYEDAEVKEKNDVVLLLKRIDPANSEKYQAIMN